MEAIPPRCSCPVPIAWSFLFSVFEFFRNNVPNANEFFRNSTLQKRGVLKQNQFGFTLGGPIVKDKLLFFGSYQGTRQRNGVGGGGAVTFFSPTLTDDRSRAPSVTVQPTSQPQALAVWQGIRIIAAPIIASPISTANIASFSVTSINCRARRRSMLAWMDCSAAGRFQG